MMENENLKLLKDMEARHQKELEEMKLKLNLLTNENNSKYRYNKYNFTNILLLLYLSI